MIERVVLGLYSLLLGAFLPTRRLPLCLSSIRREAGPRILQNRLVVIHHLM